MNQVPADVTKSCLAQVPTIFVVLYVWFFSVPSLAQQNLSAEHQNAAEPAVILYSAVWCGYCNDAKAYLKANNIDYTNLDLDVSDDYVDQLEAAGGQGIPYLVVGDKRVSGFSDADYKQALEP